MTHTTDTLVHRSVSEPLVELAEFLPSLQTLMRRCGAQGPPEEFLYRVARTYQVVQRLQYRVDVQAGFRRSAARPAFCNALRQAETVLRTAAPLRILALGCGRGLAGQRGDYAAQTVREVLPADRIGSLLLLDLHLPQLWTTATAADAVAKAGTVDLVVMHSLLHFVPNPAALLAAIDGCVAPGGGFVLGHEPNLRFWRNATIADMLNQRKSVRRRGVFALLSRLLRKARSLRPGFRAKAPELHEQVNRVLKQRYDWTGLSRHEINRIVDPHRCGERGETFRIGWDGLDLQLLHDQYLPHWRLAWRATYDHLGYGSRTEFSEPWRSLESDIAARFPDDGSSLAAFWHKPEPLTMSNAQPFPSCIPVAGSV